MQRCLIVVADNSALVVFCFEFLGVICNSLSFFALWALLILCRCNRTVNLMWPLCSWDCSIWHPDNALWSLWSGKRICNFSFFSFYHLHNSIYPCYANLSFCLALPTCRNWNAVIWNQGKGLTERVMLLYDGLHYDVLAVSDPCALCLMFHVQWVLSLCVYKCITCAFNLSQETFRVVDQARQSWRNRSFSLAPSSLMQFPFIFHLHLLL